MELIKKNRFRFMFVGLWIFPLLPLQASESITKIIEDSIIHYSDNEQSISESNPLSSSFATSSTDDKDGPSGVENIGYALSVAQQLQVETDISAETTALFGEEIDLATGAMTMSQVDVNIPGNSSLPVQIRRKLLDPKDRYNGTREFGLWSLDLPFISSSVIRSELPDAEFSGSWGAGVACSGPLSPATYHAPTATVPVASHEYWNGDSIYIPGKGNSVINGKLGNLRQAKNNWKINCVNTSQGYEGFEVTTDDGTKYTFAQLKLVPGIELSKPKPWTPSLTSPPPGFDRKGVCISRCEVFTIFHAFMLVTKVEDRFGNRVDYKYTDHVTTHGTRKLLRTIEANDGRKITLNYNDRLVSSVITEDDLATSVVTSARTWTYNYNENITDPKVDYLTSITLPDTRMWKYEGYSDMYVTEGIPADFLEDPQNPERFCVVNNRSTLLRVTHPDGLVGEFRTSNSTQGRTEVPKVPLGTVLPDGTINTYAVKRCFSVLSLETKTLTHPDGTSLTWNYHYSGNPGSFESVPGVTDSYAVKIPVEGIDDLGFPSVIEEQQGYELHDLKSTTVEAPDGSKTVHYFVRRFDWLEGAEVFVDYYDVDGITLLKRLQKNYQKGELRGDFSFGSASSANQEVRLYRQLLNEQTIYQNSQTYTTAFSDFNEYEVAKKTAETNDIEGSKSRFSKQEYRHDVTNWVLNLPTTTQYSTDDTDYTLVSENTYHDGNTSEGQYAGLNLIYEKKRYDKWLLRNISYHEHGNVKKTEFNQLLVKSDGSNSDKFRYREIIGYKRGQPTEIVYSSRYADTGLVPHSQIVDDNGWVISLTDLNQNTTTYGYSPMGRVTYVDFPDDENNWLDTLFSWDTNEVGELTRTATRCQLSDDSSECEVSGEGVSSAVFSTTTTYDGLLRPVRTENHDIKNDITRVQNRRFNAWNNPVFQSYWAGNVNESGGIFTAYDGLQRLNQTNQTGGGKQTIDYLSGNRMQFKEQVEGVKENTTITTYLAYGTPEYRHPLLINSPEGVTTEQVINVFGDVTSITQSGPNRSLTEYRAYDDQHRLCKISRADVGITVFTNNVLGEVQLMAQGVSGGSHTNCTYVADSSKAVSMTYDNFGSLWKTDYPDSESRSLTYTLDNNGNVINLLAGSSDKTVSQTYQFNSLNLPEFELLIVEGKRISPDSASNSIDYGYDGLGNLSTMAYPNGDIVSFIPNAFGEPTQAVRGDSDTAEAFKYATNATYYPTGTVDTFVYGNNQLVHKTEIDARKLPKSIKDSIVDGEVALQYEYEYDYVSNVTKITDVVSPSYSINNLVYDGLNRLTGTEGGTAIGDSNIVYDGIGNILTYDTINQSLEYDYETPTGKVGENLLRNVNKVDGVEINYKSFEYDDRGNVTTNGYDSFTYNRANQMVSSGTNSYIYDGHSRRVKQTDNEGTSYSLYSLDGTLLFRETEKGSVNYIYLGNKLIAKDGTIPENSEKQHYLPFGESLEGATDDIGYTGHKYDTDLGLSYMQARYYDPVIGRFYSNDPVDALGHMQRGNSITHGFNRYAYVNNNPYKYVDPNGEFLKLAKAAFNVVKRTIKNGGDFKKAGKEELANLADNISTLADGQLNIDDAFAVIDLATGFGDEAKKANKALRTCCFVAGTQVLTEDGYKNIEDVKLGEKLWAKNTDTGEQDWKPVTKIFVEPDRGIYEIKLVAKDGFVQKIEATDDHPFFVIGKGWKKTIELVVGDEIETDGFGPVRVESVIDEKRLDLTFNFTVADFHTYYVTKKNVLVHNCNIANMKKVNEKDGNKFAQEAGYKDAHEAKKGYGDSRVNLYRDKETGDIYIWDGKKDSEPQKL